MRHDSYGRRNFKPKKNRAKEIADLLYQWSILAIRGDIDNLLPEALATKDSAEIIGHEPVEHA